MPWARENASRCVVAGAGFNTKPQVTDLSAPTEVALSNEQDEIFQDQYGRLYVPDPRPGGPTAGQGSGARQSRPVATKTRPVANAPSPGPSRAWRRQAVKDDGKIRRHPHYRTKFLEHINNNPTLRSVTKEVAAALISHSDDSGKPAYPSQSAIAHRLHRNIRTVRRSVAELEAAGCLHVRRSQPERDRRTGRWYRKFNNYYCFRMPREAGEGRRVMRKPTSHLEGTGTPSTFLGRTTPPQESGDGSLKMFTNPAASTPPPPTVALDLHPINNEPPEENATVTDPLKTSARFAALRDALHSASHQINP